MRIERYDPESGAILFKKTEDAKKLDKALDKIEELERRIEKLEKEMKSKK